MAILACPDDDIVWVLHGYHTVRGKDAFDGEIENDAAVGGPTPTLGRLVEEGDTVVAVGSGEMTLEELGRVGFVFAEVHVRQRQDRPPGDLPYQRRRARRHHLHRTKRLAPGLSVLRRVEAAGW